MADLNRFVCTGRLTKDIATPMMSGNTESVFFSLACNGYKKEDVVFINCRAWGQSAKYLQQYAKKGNLIAVDGQFKTYKAKDGSLGWYVNCMTVVNYQKSVETSNYSAYDNSMSDSNDTYSMASDIDEDDVPF